MRGAGAVERDDPTIDDLRRQHPHLGFAVYALEPGGPVTFEAYSDGQVFTWIAPTVAGAIAQAFPPEPVGEAAPELVEPDPEPSVFD